MEEKKLNFNAPLLSVRRVATTKASSDGAKGKKIEDVRINRGHALHAVKLDSSLDQVTEPVAVPFQWEHIPGRAKGGSLSKHKVNKDASVTQRTRSGRIFDVLKHRLESKSADQSLSKAQLKVDSVNASSGELYSSRGRVNERTGFDSDDDEDVYSDALETLSPTNSLSINCSVSGLSGPDAHIVKPSGTFATDPLTRDFMMSRFLPAAKAMTLEQPHYTPKKQPPAVVEQPRQVVKMVSGGRTFPINRIESNTSSSHGLGVEEKESDDEYDECDDASVNISTKGCGWIPKLCLKNSLYLLNPVPGMKPRAQASMSSSHGIEKLSKVSNVRSLSPTMKKLSRDAVGKQKQESGSQSPRLWQVDNRLTCRSDRFSNANDWQPMSRTSSPLRRSGAISPYRNEASQSPFRGRGLLGMPKDAESFKASKVNLYVRTVSKSQELMPHYGRKHDSRSASPAIEKTLYVDSVNVAQKSPLNSGSFDIKGYKDSAVKGSKLLKSRGIEASKETESSLQDAECEKAVEGEKKLHRKSLEVGDSDSSRLSDMSPFRGQSDMVEALRDESKALICISAASNDDLSIEKSLISKQDDPENVKSTLVPPHLAPVLPKTPSESWLWRTLPSISSQNPFANLYRGNSFQNKWQDSKTSTNAKWETIVKSTNSHQYHARYSQELIPHASQKSNF